MEITIYGIGRGVWVLPSEVQAVSFTPSDGYSDSNTTLVLTLRGGATVDVTTWCNEEQLRKVVPQIWAQLRGTEDPYRG